METNGRERLEKELMDTRKNEREMKGHGVTLENEGDKK